MDPVTLIASVLLGIEALLCLYATRRFRLWFARKGQGDPYLKRLRDRNTRVALGASLIAGVIAYSLARFALPALELGPIMAPFGALLIALPLAWMMYGPIDDWLTIRSESDDG